MKTQLPIKRGNLLTQAVAVMMITVLLLAALPVTPASAAIGPTQAWASLYEGINHPGTLSYTVDAGSLRMLVVGVSTTTSDAVTQTVTATYGGQSMSVGIGDGATTSNIHTYLLYLKDTPTVMNGTAQNLVVTITGGTTKYNFVYAAVYAGVEQTGDPLRDTKTIQSSGQDIGPFSPGLTVNTGDQAVEMINIRHTNGTTIRTVATWASGWSAAFIPSGFADNVDKAGYNAYAAVRTVPGTNVTDASLHQASLSANTNSSMSGMSMKASPLTQTATTVATSGTPQTYGSLVTFTATVNNLSATGNVKFYSDGILLGSGTLTTVAGQRQAFYTTTQVQLAAATHSIIAAYDGDLTYAGSVSSPISQETTRKQINVVCDPGQYKVLGAPDPAAFTYTYDPLVPGDTFTGALARDPGETAGTYTIRVGTLQLSQNYTLIYQSNLFTILGDQPTAVTVTADAGQTKVYGAANPAAYTYTSSNPSVTFTGALARVAGENAGPYAITQGTLSAGPGYTITFVPANFTITPKPITVTADSGLTKVYGDADPVFTYTHDPLLGGDSLSGSLSRVAGENATTYAITQGSLTAGSNYTINFVSHSFSITPKPLTVTANSGQAKIYGNADPVFAYTHDPLVGGDGLSGALGRVAGENIGLYAITQGSLTAGGNYSINLVSSNFSITVKTIAVTANSGQTKAYGDADPVFTYSHDPLVGSDGFSGALTRAAGELVGPYAISQGTLTAGSNYNINFTPSNFNITRKTITVTADLGQSKSYGDADPVFTYTNDPLVGSDGFSGALTRAAGENVGPYAITQGTLTAGSNYTISFVSHNFSITPKSITVTADPGQSKVYSYGDPVFTYTHDPLLGGDTLSGVLGRVLGENAGLYAITQGSLTAGSNYSINLVSSNFSITPKPLSVTANSGQTKVYGSSDPVFAYSHDPLVGTDSLSGALGRVAGENVGPYAITLGTLTAGGNYSINLISSNFSITAKAITVTADSGQTKVYGDADPVFTYTHDALVIGDGFSGALSRVAGANVGSYAITQGTLTAGSNYSINFVSSNFSITVKSIAVTADAGQTKIYGAANPVLTYSHDPLVGGDGFSGALTRAAGENVGPYAITQGTLALSSNYTISFTGDTFNITAKTLNVTADAKSKLFGSADPSLTYSHDALSFSDTFSGALSRDAGEAIGTYAITQGTLALSSNYVLVYHSALLTILSDWPSAGIYDDADAGWNYAGAWGAVSIPGAYSDTLHIAVTQGSTGSFTFDGNGFGLRYLTFPGWGQIGVYLDGSPTALTILNTNTAAGLPTYTSPKLWPGVHTVVFKHEGGGKMVAIDAIEIAVPTYAAAGTYDDSDANWFYAGAWGAPTIPGAYNSTLHIAVTQGSTGMFSFTGSGFELSYLKYPGWGTIGVYLDGSTTPITTLNTNASAGMPAYISPALTAGPHTLMVKHEGPLGTMVAFDKIVIKP